MVKPITLQWFLWARMEVCKDEERIRNLTDTTNRLSFSICQYCVISPGDWQPAYACCHLVTDGAWDSVVIADCAQCEVCSIMCEVLWSLSLSVCLLISTRNSSGDEIVNMNFFMMTSSTTFTQCTPEATKFGEITQKRPITPLKVIQGYWFWYQLKAHMRLPIRV